MKILVDRLSDRPTPFEFAADARWWEAHRPGGEPEPLAIDQPFRVAGTAHLMGEDLFLEGRVEGSVEVECARCLARYRHPIRERLRLVLEPAGSRVPTDPEGAQALARYGICVGDDLEAGWFRGNEIDLAALCYEIVALALPVQPLCREDCAGLCPRCGADRNAGACGCSEARADSPFATLAALRSGITRRRS